MRYYAVGVGMVNEWFSDRLKAYEFIDSHPGYTDVIPVNCSDLQGGKHAEK